jgi:hypothetical protein
MANEIDVRQDRVLQYLAAIYPKGATYGELEAGLHIFPRQRIIHLMQDLLKANKVRGEKSKTRRGVFWTFYALVELGTTESSPPPGLAARPRANLEMHLEDLADLPETARLKKTAERAMCSFYGMPLAKRGLIGLPGFFSLVSEDGCTVGEVLVFEQSQGLKASPARLASISEKVWLLEKSNVQARFLAFAGDRRTAMDWLVRYAHLAVGVTFYYVREDGEVELLK